LDHNFDVQIARFNPEIQQHNLNATYGAYEPTSTFSATRSFSAAPVALNTLGEPVSRLGASPAHLKEQPTASKIRH
jgi:hypothetical protein